MPLRFSCSIRTNGQGTATRTRLPSAPIPHRERTVDVVTICHLPRERFGLPYGFQSAFEIAGETQRIGEYAQALAERLVGVVYAAGHFDGSPRVPCRLIQSMKLLEAEREV